MWKLLKIRAKDYLGPKGDDDFCPTRLVSIDAPFIILGVPVYRDYKVVHQAAAPAYMSFMHGFDDTKGVPLVNSQVSSSKLALKYEFR